MSPRPRFHRLKAAKRDSILEIAAEEFSQKGFDGASFNRIIERAGLSKGAAYYYFDDKADLFETVLQFGIEQFAEFLDAADHAPDAPEAFWQTVQDHVDRGLGLMASNPWLLRFLRMFYAMYASSPDAAVVRWAFDFGRLKTRTFIEAGQRRKAIRTDLPVDLLTETVFGLAMGLDRWFLETYDDVGEHELQAWSNAFVDLLRRVLEPKDTP